MTKFKTLRAIADPSLFISPAMKKDIAAIRSPNGYRWIDQPFWPQKNISFTKNDRTIRRKLIEALLARRSSDDLLSLGYRILTCSANSKCGSPLCNYCRTKLQDRYEARVFQYFGDTHRLDLRWLTILDDLSYNPIEEIQDRITKRRRSLREFLKRHCGRDVSVFGAFEVDVKHPNHIRDGDDAFDLLRQYGLRKQSSPAFMPHIHVILSLNGISGAALDKELKSLYAKPSQVKMMRLWPRQTKLDNLTHMARYMFKFRYQFADNILRDRTSYGSRFDDNTLRKYAQVIELIKGERGVRGLEFSYNIR